MRGWAVTFAAALIVFAVPTWVAGAVGAGQAGSDAAVVPRVGPVSVVSRGCPGSNAEAEQAVDGRYVYETWIGCGNQGGIGFARSVDGGRHFGHPMRVPGSAPPGHAFDLPAEGWDPAIAVAPNGTVYVSFMIARRYAHPVVAVSVDHGAHFTRVEPLMPPALTGHNLGDRDFIAVAPNGTIYLTWIYGAHYHPFGVTYTHPVIQKSADAGRTWSRLMSVSPGFPGRGAAAAPLLVEPNGQVDVLLWVNGSIRNHHYVHSPADDFFTSSVDGGSSWSRPVRLGPTGFRIDPRVVFWIDADISIDSSGVLYATWDTQSPGGDIGWLSYSLDHGRTWSAPRAATTSRGGAEHHMAVAGGRAGIVYVGWETNSSPRGWAQYLRPFSIHKGWLSAPVRISPKFGDLKGWPGDTIGLSTLPGLPGRRLQPVMVSWGVPTQTESQIWAARIGMG